MTTNTGRMNMLRVRGFRRILPGLAWLLTQFTLLNSGFAGPVVYDESVTGDLSQDGFPLQTFAFDVGLNTISGHTGLATLDLDSFAFVVPGDTEIDFWQITTTDLVNGSAYRWHFYSGSINHNQGTLLEEILLFTPGTYTPTSVPLGTGNYNLSAQNFGFNPGEADYTISFHVVSTLTAVPEPGTLTLAGLGTIGFLTGALCRRRRDVTKLPT